MDRLCRWNSRLSVCIFCGFALLYEKNEKYEFFFCFFQISFFQKEKQTLAIILIYRVYQKFSEKIVKTRYFYLTLSHSLILFDT